MKTFVIRLCAPVTFPGTTSVNNGKVLVPDGISFSIVSSLGNATALELRSSAQAVSFSARDDDGEFEFSEPEIFLFAEY